jgi:membrane associated rhomboid family serine protease
MYNVGFNRFGGTPPVIKNLIYLNVIMFVATLVLESSYKLDLTNLLGLHYPSSDLFKPVQVVTHMFMHGGVWHIFFNMFALWMFGKILESVWGSQRFFIYYIVTGVGAAAIHLFVTYLRINNLVADMDPELVAQVYREGAGVFIQKLNYTHPDMAELNLLINTPTVGASGAVYGVLLAFGMLFPNTELMFLFPPVPIKAKYVVIGYGAIELFTGLTQPGSNVAHFAHLGGMLFGFILIKFWSKKRTNFY